MVDYRGSATLARPQQSIPLVQSERTSSSPLEATITINPEKTYQTMDGFGAAMTGSSAHLMNQLPQEKREQLLHDLFTSEGLNMDMVRHTIGASDYSVDASGAPASYTYDDVESGTDYAMEHFSIDQDQEVVGMLQQVIGLKPHMKIMGTPWTAPAWMKYGEKTLHGWYLNYEDPQVYEVYAQYFVRYIQAYQDKGLPIYGVTLQNEPGFTSPNYPSMSMGAEEQAGFIRDYLGPALRKAGLDTRIIAYDHNWDEGVEYTDQVLGINRLPPILMARLFIVTPVILLPCRRYMIVFRTSLFISRNVVEERGALILAKI